MGASLLSVVLLCTATLGHSLPSEANRVLSVRALRGQIQHGTVLPPQLRELIEFYRWLGWSLATRGGDEAGKARFRSLYVDPQDFDGIGVRRLLSLSLNPEITVFGITEVTKVAEPDRFSVLADAATRPALDRRCQDRAAYNKQHERRKNEQGEVIALDPVILNWGPVEGLGSDEWSRAALPPGATSTNADERSGLSVVEVAPGVEVRGGAAELAQLHMDMSVLAVNWGDQEFKQVAEYLSLIWLGGAFHFVQQAADPLNNVQLSGRNMMVWLRARGRQGGVHTLGGWLGEWRPQGPSALRLRAALKRAADAWLNRRIHAALDGDLTEGPLAEALTKLSKGDPEFDAAVRPGIQPWLQSPKKPEPSAKGRGAVSVVVDALAAAGVADGAKAYDLLIDLTGVASLSDVPQDLKLQLPASSPKTKDKLQALEAIYARAMLRGATATQMAFDAWLNANAKSALDRLRRVRTLGLEREMTQEDRAHTLHALVRPRRISPWWAGLPAALLLLVAVGIVRRRRLA